MLILRPTRWRFTLRYTRGGRRRPGAQTTDYPSGVIDWAICPTVELAGIAERGFRFLGGVVQRHRALGSNPRDQGSIPCTPAEAKPNDIAKCRSPVDRHVEGVGVAGSIPALGTMFRWQSGYAAGCKPVQVGSIPARNSIFFSVGRPGTSELNALKMCRRLWTVGGPILSLPPSRSQWFRIPLNNAFFKLR